MDTEYIDIVMSEPPGPASQFVEAEDAQGRGVGVGEWLQREDGYWVLRILVPTSEVRR